MECEIIQSPNDKKVYKYLKLGNGLSVLLIHDPAVAEALAAPNSDQQQGDGQQMDMSEDASEASASEDAEGSSADEGESDTSESGSGSEGSGSENGSEEESESGVKGKVKAAGSKKAAAAMAVGVGSFSDPLELQGLSHYLEHMLFMGSDKYPDENEYDSYLTKNGGSSNAFTELEFTNYHFDVAPRALEGALDRFAQFFVAPLFQASALEREVQAVDSEFMGVLQSDHSRLAQLMCHTSKPGHVYNKFSWGNIKSLWDTPRQAGLDVRQRIIDYYRQEYGPARMHLVLLGGQSLAELESWVQEKFGGIPAGTVGPAKTFRSAGRPFAGRVMYVVPAVKEHHEVSVTFQLPCLRDEYTVKPDHYISHLVGHEGPGSLLSSLKARGWAVELCAGVDDDGYSANSATYLFSVNITLTEAGLTAAPGYGLAPVALLFQYLRLLTRTGPQQWVWEEIQSIAAMKFRFIEEEDSCDIVTRLASSMGWVKPEHLLVADYMHLDWNPEKVMELLSCMDPRLSSYRIDLLTKSFGQFKQQLTQQQSTKSATAGDNSQPSSELLLCSSSGSCGIKSFTEPWFNMEAVSVELPDDLTASWQTAESADDLALPPQNPYIPSDFELKADSSAAAAAARAGVVACKDVVNGIKQQQQQQQVLQELQQQGVERWMLVGGDSAAPEAVLAAPPTMLKDEPGLRVWHKLALSYQQPRLAVYTRLSGPAAAASPAAAVLGGLWFKMIEEALAEDAYLADVAGLHWSGSSEGVAGFEVRLEGFSHNLDKLATTVFNTLAQCQFKESRFPAVHEQLLRRYKNALLQPSKAAAAARLRCLSGGPHWSNEQMVAALEQVKGVEEVQAFAREFLCHCHMECLLLGNITAAEATALSTTLSKRLRAVCSTPDGSNSGNSSSSSGYGLLLADARPVEQCVKLPGGVVLLHREAARNLEEENCCVEVYYQVGLSSLDLKLRVLTDLADQVLYEPLYDSLRTKQQLGYTVSSGARLTHGVSGFCVVVVSAAFDAREVEQRIEQFMVDFQQTIQCMSADELERHKSALISNKLQKDTAIHQEGDRFWEQIFNCRYEFLCKEQEVALLQQLTLQDFQQYYATYLAPTSQQRRKLSVQVYPTKGGKAMQTDQQQQQDITNQQQQQHVVHELGVVHHPAHHAAAGAAKVRAGAAGAVGQQQQQHDVDTESAVAEPDAVSPLNLPKAKRQRQGQQQQQQQQQQGGATAVSLPAGMRVQLIGDIDEFKQGCERYPVYCTVKPELTLADQQ